MEGAFGEAELAELPFLPEAGGLLVRRGYALKVSELAEYSDEDFFKLGLERARDGVLRGRVEYGAIAALRPEHRILSFIVAAMVVSLLKDKFLVKRFSLAEARRVEELAESKLRDREEAFMFLSALHWRLLGVRLERAGLVMGSEMLDARMRLLDYLRLSAPIGSPEWGISNRVVSGGMVYLGLEDTARLLRNAVADEVERRISSISLVEPPEPLRRAAEELAKAAIPLTTAQAPPQVGEGQYPPCIRALLKRLEAGENLPHTARFLLATFMVNAGVQVDGVVAAFSRSPDFNERITRYQVEHIAGLRGGKRYSVPSCAKVQSLGLCTRDETCDDVRSPLQYAMRRAGGRRESRGEEGADEPRRGRTRIPEDEL